MFITFEGGEGTGKTTQINILKKYLYKNVLLVGDYGSGKRSVVEGYCKYLQELFHVYGHE